jgi:hypothetical protein
VKLLFKPKINRFKGASLQKKKRQQTAGAGLSAYETNSYAYQQIPQRQTRISRKMRVKTPNVNSSKGTRKLDHMRATTNSGCGGYQNTISFTNANNRPTTAVGLERLDNPTDFIAKKGRRFLGSAKPGPRRKLKNNMMASSNENQMHFMEFGSKYNTNDIGEDNDTNKFELNNRPLCRQKEPSNTHGIDYVEDLAEDEAINKYSQEIVLTTGIPAPAQDFTSKYTPSQGKR